MYNFILRSQTLVRDKDTFCNWQIKEENVQLIPEETAVIIVDMWDKHWCAGAVSRSAPIAEQIDKAVCIAREKGTLIVHAPSDVTDFYKNTEAYKRLLTVPALKNIPEKELKDYPQPIDSSDGGSDTIQDYAPHTIVWTRQIEKIYIDNSKDIIGENGDLIYSYLRAKNINNIIYMGVHTNMCVLHRPFAIKAMLRRGMNVILCRDLTDSMYNPAMPPYVSHDEGTRLIVEYIEKFYCPTISGDQIK